jgi:uncharacterized membrane-anchored protein
MALAHAREASGPDVPARAMQPGQCDVFALARFIHFASMNTITMMPTSSPDQTKKGMPMHRSPFRSVLFALLLSIGLAVSAEPAPTAREAEYNAAIDAVRATKKDGPTSVRLGEQATLDVPEHFAFVPVEAATKLMHAMGNQTDEGFMGMVIGDNMSGFITVRFDKAGYIKDDDARDWNADELLQNLKDGTEAGNETRRAQGIPEFTVDGWVEAPHYQAGNHRLVWSARLRDKVATSDHASPGVNYNTYLLGREGYVSMNLVTDLAGVEAQKPIAHQMLDNLHFVEGKRYEDFNASTDDVAAYGLAALVGGVAAKKLGLLATVGIFLAKFWKIALIAVIGFGAGIRKLFARKQSAE